MTFAIAIIGRPNVGKSTLFNRLVGKKLALVDDQPGVTRDRRSGEARLGDLNFTVIDTAGLEEGDSVSLTGRMRAQTEAAIDEADGIFFVIDARVGITPEDRYFASLVRRASKPLILVANKAEGRVGEAGAYEAFDLGLGDPVALSAEHGDGFAELYSALLKALPEATELSEDDDERRERLVLGEEEEGSELDPTKPLRIAVVGRPNAGKSTLINRILGEDRLLVGPEAGITRDSIGVDFLWRGRDVERQMKIFDTAGLRRRARVEEKLEKLAAADALRAIRFAEVVVVLLDATIPFEKQDLSITDLVVREGRALVIAVNKWDLIADKAEINVLREEAARLLPQVRGALVMPVSGATGAGLRRLDGRHFERPRSLEQAPVHGAAQSLAGGGDRPEPAAGGFRPADKNPLYHPAQGAPAAFRPVRQSARRIAGILSPLSDERLAAVFFLAGHADPHDFETGG